jgi:hypothetical protein
MRPTTDDATRICWQCGAEVPATTITEVLGHAYCQPCVDEWRATCGMDADALAPDSGLPGQARADEERCPDCGCGIEAHIAIVGVREAPVPHCQHCGVCWTAVQTPFVATLRRRLRARGEDVMRPEAWGPQIHDMMTVQSVLLRVEGMAGNVTVELLVQEVEDRWTMIGEVHGAASLDAAMTTIFARLDGEATP